MSYINPRSVMGTPSSGSITSSSARRTAGTSSGGPGVEAGVGGRLPRIRLIRVIVPVSSVTNSGRKERGALEAPLSVRLDRLVSEPVLQVVGGEATLDLLSGLTGALLDASDQFLVVALGNVEIVVGQVPPGLLDLAFELVPATFPLHTGSFVSHGS